jgi:hypothetical protein
MLLATGGFIAPARNVFPAHESSVDHRGGASNPTVDSYGIGRTVELTGTAFHTGIIPHNLDPSVSRRKNPVWTHV